MHTNKQSNKEMLDEENTGCHTATDRAWHITEIVHSWRPYYSAELMKQYYSASMTVETVRTAVRMQTYLLTYKGVGRIQEAGGHAP